MVRKIAWERGYTEERKNLMAGTALRKETGTKVTMKGHSTNLKDKMQNHYIVVRQP